MAAYVDVLLLGEVDAVAVCRAVRRVVCRAAAPWRWAWAGLALAGSTGATADLVRLPQLSPQLRMILASGIVAYRRARESTLVLYPHVQMTLLELAKRGIRLGVVSDAPRLQVWMRLCALGLQHLFDAVVTFDDTGERKPAPAPFREVLRRLGVEPAQALMIGDWAERDVVGAKSLGMRTVFARYGDTFDTRVSGADHDIDDVLELLAIVDQWNGQPPGDGGERRE